MPCSKAFSDFRRSFSRVLPFFHYESVPGYRDGEDDDGEPDDTEARHLRCIERFIVKEDADKK